MIRGGLLEEVFRLYGRGYPRELKSMQSLGYRHASMVLAGQMDLVGATRLMKRDTRHYAKRQLTWFRSEPGVLWCDPDDIKGIGLKVSNFLGD
jgi:tRNA dimethylallyltransferase